MYTLRCLMILAASFAGATLACEYPPLVAIPDGENATLEEMLEGQTSVRAYQAAMNEFLVCTLEGLNASGPNAVEEYAQIMAARHDYAYAEMETVAEIFNKQVQAYRAANPPEPESE